MKCTFEHATQQARHIISATCGATEVAIIEKATQEFDVGWVFFYQSSRFLKTGDAQDALVGNAPLFVSRQDGQAAFISHHRPIVESIDAYRACGDPNAHEEPQLELTGWLAGADKVQAVALIRRYSRLTLADAKHAIDGCLGSSEVIVNTEDVASAKQLVIALAKVGFLGAVSYKRVGAAPHPTNDR